MINPIEAAPLFGQRIVSKVMGLIAAVIGVQFVLNGVEAVALSILKASRG